MNFHIFKKILSMVINDHVYDLKWIFENLLRKKKTVISERLIGFKGLSNIFFYFVGCPTITSSLKEVSVLEGLSATLECTIMSSPLPTVTWYKGTNILQVILSLSYVWVLYHTG